MHKILILKQVLNNFYINDTKVNHEQFNNIFNDLKHYKQIGFSNYIEHKQLVNKWILKAI